MSVLKSVIEVSISSISNLTNWSNIAWFISCCSVNVGLCCLSGFANVFCFSEKQKKTHTTRNFSFNEFVGVTDGVKGSMGKQINLVSYEEKPRNIRVWPKHTHPWNILFHNIIMSEGNSLFLLLSLSLVVHCLVLFMMWKLVLFTPGPLLCAGYQPPTLPRNQETEPRRGGGINQV